MPRLLLDANMPIGLKAALVGHEVVTAFEMGWSSLSNGDLLAAAEAADFDAMITGDSNIQYQQNLAGRKLSLVVLLTNHWPTIRANMTRMAAIVGTIQAGTYVSIPFVRASLRRRKPRGRSVLE